MSEFVTIGPEAFSDAESTVISYKGENYYRACGHKVADLDDGGESSCVKRVGHTNEKEHEDFHGNIYHEFYGTNPPTLTIPFPSVGVGLVVTGEALDAAWAKFVTPEQEQEDGMSDEGRTVAACLRAIKGEMP